MVSRQLHETAAKFLVKEGIGFHESGGQVGPRTVMAAVTRGGRQFLPRT